MWRNPLFRLPEKDTGGEKSSGDAASPTTDNISFDHFLDRYGVRAEDLPDDIAAMIPMIAQFAGRCSGSGASSRLVMSFEGMASIMLAEVARAHQEKLLRLGQQNPDETAQDMQEARQLINRQSTSLRDILLRKLEEVRAAPEGKRGRDADIRTLERGLRELDEVIEISSDR
jgi:hypothetical protein